MKALVSLTLAAAAHHAAGLAGYRHSAANLSQPFGKLSRIFSFWMKRHMSHPENKPRFVRYAAVFRHITLFYLTLVGLMTHNIILKLPRQNNIQIKNQRLCNNAG